MPVVLAWLEEDAIAWPDQLDRPALPLAQANALGDPDRLTVRVRVPGGARTRGEMHCCGADRRLLRRRSHGVDEDRSGEPVVRAGAYLKCVAGDLHECSLSSQAACPRDSASTVSLSMSARSRVAPRDPLNRPPNESSTNSAAVTAVTYTPTSRKTALDASVATAPAR